MILKEPLLTFTLYFLHLSLDKKSKKKNNNHHHRELAYLFCSVLLVVTGAAWTEATKDNTRRDTCVRVGSRTSSSDAVKHRTMVSRHGD